MLNKRMTVAVIATAVLWSGASLAQSSGTLQTPAEQPPAGFAGPQYVDSNGCVFVRVDLNGRTNWVPRLSRGREQICGASPSQAARAVDAETVPQAPVAVAPQVRTQTATAQPVARPRPVTVAAPKPRIVKARPAAPAPKPVLAPVTRSKKGKPLPSTSFPGKTRVVPLHVATARARAGEFTVPKGYRAAWQDDRLNPRRSEGTLAGRDAMNLIWTTTVPRRLINRATGRDVTAKVALVYPYTDLDIQRRELGRVTLSSRNGQIVKQVQRPARKATVSSRSGGETLAGNLYVQAGIFRTKGNAQKRASHLKRLGLSVRIGKFSRNGETMRLVLAGPYTAQADASAALQSVKRAGFSDAFVRK